MPIPDCQTIILPLLQLSEDGREHSMHDAVEKMAERIGITEEEQAKLLSSASLKYCLWINNFTDDNGEQNRLVSINKTNR